MTAVSGGKHRGMVPGVLPPLALPRRLLRMRSDAVLAERAAAGDEAAFDVLYERHRPVVLAVCMGVLGTAHDAEDATQETFAALSVTLRSKIPPELRPWLIRVARNASIDTTRRRKHRLLTFDGELPEIPVRPSTAEVEFEVVLDGIRELPEQQRTALLMRELGGHSYAEIGEFMELEEAAVRGLIARARVGLRSYREATELPCATARASIETEPDGRRYDKTIRRHLRGCASCRSYRTALRGDAKALRAGLPFQTGAFSSAGGGLATGVLGASKAALVGGGMTQLAATCAASVCAVGAVGGMVLLAPVHRLLAKPVVAAVPTAHHHRASHAAAVSGSTVVSVTKVRTHPGATGASHTSAVRARHHRSDRPAVSGGSTGIPTKTGITHTSATTGSAAPGSAVHQISGATPAVGSVQTGAPAQSATPASTARAPASSAGAPASSGTGSQTIAGSTTGSVPGTNGGTSTSTSTSGTSNIVGTSTTGAGTGGASNPVGVTNPAGGTSGVTNPAGGTSGVTNPVSGASGAVTPAGGGSSATSQTGTGTISTPTVPAPITNTVSNVVHPVTSNPTGQSTTSTSTQTSTTPTL